MSNIIRNNDIDLVLDQNYYTVQTLFNYISANLNNARYFLTYHNNPCIMLEEEWAR